MTVNEYLKATRQIDARQYYKLNPAIVCADGLRLSVQASEGHYCAPRDNFGPWAEVEVGYPSAVVPELMEYAESPATPLETVYGYVPVELVDAVIAAHGGISNTPATPYQRGFEDATYDRIYANPYRPGSTAWVAYDRGNQDARAATRPEVQP